jgi:hypothetical protein
MYIVPPPAATDTRRDGLLPAVAGLWPVSDEPAAQDTAGALSLIQINAWRAKLSGILYRMS